MEKAYEEAVKQFTKLGDIQLAVETQKELETFRSGATPKDDETSIFNGKNLAGWESMPRLWNVRDGGIVGTRRGGTHNTCLVTTKDYADFELQCSLKLVGGPDANSGIHFRSQVDDGKEFRLSGPQLDAGSSFWGSVYQVPSGMLKRLDPKIVDRVVKYQQFNDILLRCVGKRVTISINGEIVVDDEFPKLPSSGRLGFELHKSKGQPVGLFIKDLHFSVIDSKADK